MKLKRILTLLALTAMLVAPSFAGDAAQCPGNVTRSFDSDTDIIDLVETAEKLATVLPSRARVATIDDENSRLFLEQLIRHVELAAKADQMTILERERFGAEVRSAAASAAVGISAVSVCPVSTTAVDAVGVEIIRGPESSATSGIGTASTSAGRSPGRTTAGPRCRSPAGTSTRRSRRSAVRS